MAQIGYYDKLMEVFKFKINNNDFCIEFNDAKRMVENYCLENNLIINNITIQDALCVLIEIYANKNESEIKSDKKIKRENYQIFR